MNQTVVTITAIICLALLGIVSSFAFSESVARVVVTTAIGVIATICGATGGIAIRNIIRRKKQEK